MPAGNDTSYRQFPRPARTGRQKVFFLICVIVVFVVVSIAVFFALGGGKGPSEIRFEVHASGETSYTFSYLDGNGIHQSQNTRTGSYSVSIKGASSANLIVTSASSVTAYAYVDGRLVDQQSGTYVLVSATP